MSSSANIGWAANRRQAAAIFVYPAPRISPMTVLRSPAMTCGILPQRTCERSSSKVTSRTQCDWFSITHWPRISASNRGASQTWPKHPLHQCGNNRLYSAARREASTLSAQVRRATIAAQARGVAPSAPWTWGDRRSRILAASTESVRLVVRQNAWGKRRRREYL
jgi:hypothetical protein